MTGNVQVHVSQKAAAIICQRHHWILARLACLVGLLSLSIEEHGNLVPMVQAYLLDRCLLIPMTSWPGKP
jgi:hypothetical protein